MRIDRLIYADLDKIHGLQPDGWPDIVHEFSRYMAYEFCEPIKVSIGNHIVGLGSAIVFKKTAWIAHVIVDKNYRNRGVGYHIVDYLISQINNHHIETILLIATKLGEPVYKKAGFRPVSHYVYLKREKDWRDKELSKHIQPYQSPYYQQIIALDALISGESREPLMQKHLDDCLVYLENQELKGFYLPTLGEGAIYATHPDIGVCFMELKYSIVDKAVLPSENEHGIDFLTRNGFVKTQDFGKRMVLGKNINWKPACIYSRIGGNYG